MVCLADGVGLLSMLSLSPNPTRNPSWKWRPQRRSPSPCPGEHWGQHQQRTAVVTPSVVIVDVRVELVPHRIAFPSPPSLECCPFVPVSVVTIGDQLRQDAPPPHPCPIADCYFYPSLSPSLPLDPPPSSSRHGLHLNLCCRRGGLILPGRHLRHVDWQTPHHRRFARQKASEGVEGRLLLHLIVVSAPPHSRPSLPT